MRKAAIVLLILLGCPVALLAIWDLTEYGYRSLEGCLSLILITLQGCGWFIVVAKSRYKRTTKLLLCGYVVLFSIIALKWIWVPIA
jgi:hypothetical protein